MVTTRNTKVLKRVRNDAESSDSDSGASSNSGDETAGNPGSAHIYGHDTYFCTRDEFHDVLNHLNDMQRQPFFRRAYPSMMRDMFNKLHVGVMSWTWNWGRDEKVAHLSEDEKQCIIASLEGQCVQDDWDSIKALCPLVVRDHMCHVLLEAMLYRFIFATFIESPFWFLDGRIDPTDVEGDPQFPRRFQHLYERLRAASGFGAACLKSSIISESNDMPLLSSMPPDTEIAQVTLDRRKTLINVFTDELLERRVFQLLLRPLDDDAEVARRRHGLHRLLGEAVETIIYTEGGIYGNSMIFRLPELPVFDYEDERMTSHHYHFVNTRRIHGNAPASGGRTLIVARPGLTYVDMQSLGKVARRPPCQMFPAEVVAEALPEKTCTKPKAKSRKTKSRNKKPKTDSKPDSKSAVSETPSVSQVANVPDAENDPKEERVEKAKTPPLEHLVPRLRKTFWRE
ncbi:hypothetical protein AAWM_01894 [Aspergillus awamori]|uniref:Uncharacterized protein n=1 Tax=Aspergillus awamori TaxID=105351 RepID=A0A401KII3_ASPAW|nr:hypothetical protein AAWM_01894 [Aspergillus awamori]GKZ61045.1 hypothetical protein AnigIFM49718_007750 [Aspergillus niger]GKZ74241.1 hypothetical protein AnigIFM50267_011740 [Aspergillus niger]GLA09133.1 hypothetical protein AnigIFM60653_011211 [Aspergillus niger]GLA21327.1 hypothetical protein AnigIFM62618_010634 [Aspergillus niger]